MKYVPGLMVGQLSGKAGNTVASHNRFGSYLRTRVVPVNPNTPNQTEVRVDLEDLSEGWKALTAEQRAAWTALGAQMERLDRLGQTYTLTGLQAWTSLNMTLRATGGADVTDAPAMPGAPVAPTIGTVTLEEGVGGLTFTVAFTPTPIGAATKIAFEATRPVSAGKSFMPRSEYKLMTVSAANGASPIDAETAYLAAYGMPPAGSKVFFQVYTLDANGFKSVRVKGDAIKVDV